MRTRQTFSASNACEPRCSQCRPTDQRCPVGCMAAATVRRDACRNLHPTSSPTTSRSPSVLGRSDRTESLDGSVISFVLLHRRLLKVNPLSCGAATMLHTWPTRHQIWQRLCRCGCRCNMCKCDLRDQATIPPTTSAAVKVHHVDHPRWISEFR